MPKKREKSKPVQSDTTVKSPNTVKVRAKEALMLLVLAVAVFLGIALGSYHTTDPGWSTISNLPVQNLAGRFGALSADFLFSLFGFFAYLLPLLMLYGDWVVFRERHMVELQSYLLLVVRFIGAILVFLSGSGLASLTLVRVAEHMPQGAGGIVGYFLQSYTEPYLNFYGSLLVFIAVFLIGITLFSGLSWLHLLRYALLGLRWLLLGAARCAAALGLQTKQQCAEWRDGIAAFKQEKQSQTEGVSEGDDAVEPDDGLELVDAMLMETAVQTPKATPAAKAKLKQVAPALVSTPPEPKDAAVTANTPLTFSGKVPSVTLLDKAKASKNAISQRQLEETAALVEEKLSDFGIKSEVVGVCPGPIVTRYELQMAPGTKVSKLTGLAKDIARSLATHSVRIVEVIPGKPYVGLEIPNEKRDMVSLREVLEADVFTQQTSPLTMGLGKDIAGKPQVVNLGKMPHLLVAGTTGSGKSVGLNAMLLSMLLKATPDELRLIMIDPKMLELSIYEGIPHLLTPVVTDMKEAANALRWCVREMDRRYRLMAALGVRNIAGMNDKVAQAKASGAPLKDPIWAKDFPDQDPEQAPELEPLPYIVVLVDEFADMMMVAGKKVEELIARLAQKARAAGIHLILATQRPSVDVITGLIKANIPTRMAFQVSSRIDSRTVLDQQGAEQLLGHGDMLYLPPGTGVPIRIHGAFVADHEVHKIVAAWQQQGEPDYIEEILATDEEQGGGEVEGAEDLDPLYDKAVKIVLDTQRASISGIQRRLKIGYNRAARLIEQMEEQGIVSEMQQNGMREILRSGG